MTIDQQLEELGQRVLATPEAQAYISVETAMLKALVRDWMDYQAFSGRQSRHVKQLREENERLRQLGCRCPHCRNE